MKNKHQKKSLKISSSKNINGKKPVLSIIIPVYNEGCNLEILLPLLKPMVPVSHEILVVHDIPNDDSIPAVKSMHSSYPQVRLVHNTLGRGVINAIKTGFSSAKGKYVLIIAADDIGPLVIIKPMLELMENGCDFVNATRYTLGGKNIGGIPISRMLSRVANSLFRVLSGSALSDPTLGVKMMRRELFESVHLESKPIGWAFSFELAIKAQLSGWKLGEIPLISLNRLYGGKSSFRLGPWVKEYSRWFVWGIIQLRKSKSRSISVMRSAQRHP